MDTKVRISKISQVENAIFNAANIASYKAGQINEGVSLPVEYYVEGFFEQEPVVGKPVVVNRINRNGIEMSGVFVTSRVTEVNKREFKTLNSVYKIEYI